MRRVKIGSVELGDGCRLAVIAGPCVIEDEGLVLSTAAEIDRICRELELPWIFKSSYIKDNRGVASSYQGPGLSAGLKILAKVRDELGVPILSDVHTPEQATAAGEVLDVIQIPAFLCQQTELLVSAARTGRAVNVKKGQFLAPEDMHSAVSKIEGEGNERIILTERGSSFGYHRLVSDLRCLPIMRELGYPVAFDVTHIIRIYGRPSSDPSGGEPRYIFPLARAAVAAGCDALFVEVHPSPGEARCDSASMLPLDRLKPLLSQVKAIDELAAGFPLAEDILAARRDVEAD